MVPKSDGGRRRSQFAVDGGVSERRRRRRGYDDEIQWLDGLGFGEDFHSVLGLNQHGISVAGGVLIYVDGILSQREGCCRRVEGNRLMQVFCWDGSARTRSLLVQGRVRLNRHIRENKWVYRVSRLQRIESKDFWFEAVVILVLQKLQVGEIMMRDLQGMQRYFQEREDSLKLHQKGCTGLRRRSQRSSISQGHKVFQRSQGKLVILSKDDQWILQLHRRNRVEQVVTNGCNPEEKGCETTVINTCSRSGKSLPQLVEACVSYTLEESSRMS
ncbi:hypothetical protein DY000_02022104 [Brassica cretica]|uniref:Uncharacterized protein n=1 Tax=Brassica cretica TaxID=69181 RepID=A0ABQ7EFA9_BRACR|nr:hypothetical protein DY000_02022104 [Brassica cretica]